MVASDVRSRFTTYNGLFGRDVITSDGVKVGWFDQVVFSSFKDHSYMLVKTGALGGLTGTDALYVPQRAVDKISESKVVLKVSAHEIGEQGWSRAPQGVQRW
jgi:sporulation protein YlmC with PRC-barrel domain